MTRSTVTGKESPFESDPFGGNFGTISNYQPQYGTVNPDFLPIKSEFYPFIDGQRVPCTLDGMAVSWHMLERMAASGALTVGTKGGWQFPVEWHNGSIFVPRTYRADPANDYLPGTSSWWVVSAQTLRQPQTQVIVKKPQIAKFDEQKFKDCVKGLFNTDVGSYEIGKKFSGHSSDSVDWFTDFFIEPFFGDQSGFEVNTTAIHSTELSFMVGGVMGTPGKVVFGWTYSDSTENYIRGRGPKNNYVTSDFGGKEFQQAIWVYELGNALGYITGNKPPVKDAARYENVSLHNKDDVGGALMDCVYGGAVDPMGRVRPPRPDILQ